MDLAERLLLVAQRTGDQALRLQAHHALWTTCLSRGDVAAGLEHANAGCALYCVDQHSGMAARYGNHDPGACAHVDLALMLALRGEVSRARSMCDAGVGLTEEIDHPFSRAISLHVTAMIYQLLREPQLARRHAAVGVQVSKEHGFPLLGAWTQVILEWAGIDDTDEPQVVLERMHAALDVARRTGTRQMSAYLCSVLADACLKVGQVDAARVAIAEGHAVTEATNGRLFQSELLRLEGEAELLAARAVAPEAGLEFVQRGARLFTRAIEVAHGQTAHLLELRAALSYARTASATHDAGHASRQLQESLAQLPADDDCADRRDARIWLTAVRPPSYLPTSLVPE